MTLRETFVEQNALGGWPWRGCSRYQPATQPQQTPARPVDRYPSWAFPLKVEKTLPPEGPEPQTLAGSSRSYAQNQIDDLLNPPDWFPHQHPDPPAIVLKGHGEALACGACHLMSGLGHPESADLTGLTVAYMVQQMKDFKAGARIDVPRMNKIASKVSRRNHDRQPSVFRPTQRFTSVIESERCRKRLWATDDALRGPEAAPNRPATASAQSQDQLRRDCGIRIRDRS